MVVLDLPLTDRPECIKTQLPQPHGSKSMPHLTNRVSHRLNWHHQSQFPHHKGSCQMTQDDLRQLDSQRAETHHIPTLIIIYLVIIYLEVNCQEQEHFGKEILFPKGGFLGPA